MRRKAETGLPRLSRRHGRPMRQGRPVATAHRTVFPRRDCFAALAKAHNRPLLSCPGQGATRAALRRRAGTQGSRRTLPHGPRLCSASRRQDAARCAASGARERSIFAPADTPSRSRGLFCPSFAFVLSPSRNKGRREGRTPAGTRDPHAKNARGVITGVAGAVRPSLRNGFTAYGALSPGSDALLPPSPCGRLTRAPGRAASSPQGLTHRLRASGPHAFCRPRTSLAERSQARACSPAK
jgi:hypothetical protein